MPLLLALLMLLCTAKARGACADDGLAALDRHVEESMDAWREGLGEAQQATYGQLLEDLACLAGSGLKTRDPDLFLVLAHGALDAGDTERALAAARALLVVAGEAPLPMELVSTGGGLAAIMEQARAQGPDAAGFRTLFLGQPPEPLTPPSPEQLAALERERLLAEVHARVALDQRGRRVGATCATLGAVTTGLSLSLLAARATEGERKNVAHMIHREAMGRVWTTTAITGGLTTVFGMWMLHQAKR